MAKTLSTASEEYVKLVEEAVAETGLDRMGVDFQVYNLLKTKNEVVRVQKANEIAEILTNREDLVIISIFEKAFDKVDEKARRLWLEAALAPFGFYYAGCKEDHDERKWSTNGWHSWYRNGYNPDRYLMRGMYDDDDWGY